jgi:rod shape-determining protein MreC
MFFGFLAVIAGILAGLVLLAISLVSPPTFQRIRGSALDLVATIAAPLHGATATAQGLVSGAGNYWDAAHQNEALKAERRKLLQRMIEAKAIQQENRQLRATLALRDSTGAAIATGRIVGSSFTSPRRFAILSVGRGDGVEIGMPVRAAEGLVGRVIDTGNSAARVLLVSDKASIVPARLLRGGQAVIAQGRGDGTIDVRPLEVGRNPFKRGDLIVTSGTGGLYPPLIPIAKVVKLDDDGAIAIPLADPARVSFAIVQAPFVPAAGEVSAAADAAPDPS